MKLLKITDSRAYTLSDNEVISRVLSGEKKLYEILLRRNNQILYRVIRSYLKEEEDIEDCMQNAYLKAYEKLHQFKRDAKFSTWLIRIAINEALARLKTKGKHIALHKSKDYVAHTGILEIADTNQVNPEKKVIRQEAKQMLENAIDKLGAKYKSVYVLREIEGMSIAEVSGCLQISNANVKVRLHRAKTKIKENLYQSTSKKELFEFGLHKCDNLVKKVMRRL